MPIFGASTDASSKLPVDKVKTMRAQGMDNNQIIQALQGSGYSSTDIFDALNQADMASGGPPKKSMPDSASSSNQEFEYHDDSNFSSRDMPPPASSHSSGMMAPPDSGNDSSYGGDVSTEELVEAIIDEKWNELLKDVNKIVEWKNSMNNKISLIEQKFNDIKAEFDKLEMAVLRKVDDYDKNITNVGAEVKAMEKVFSKVLPVFTENVSELSKISKSLKKGKK